MSTYFGERIMIAQINLREISQGDRFAPDEGYALRKAASAVNVRPEVYRIEGDILYVDTSKAALPILKLRHEVLYWGYQWNSSEM
jgi:hypothetical protein